MPEATPSAGTPKMETSRALSATQAMQKLVIFKRLHRQAKKPITPKKRPF